MKQVIIDTNFIMACIRQKIDFFEDLKFMGLEVVVPDRVLEELQRLKEKHDRRETRREAEFALRLLEKNEFKKIALRQKFADRAIIFYAKNNPKVIIATLDRGIKDRIRNPKVVIRDRKKLEVI